MTRPPMASGKWRVNVYPSGTMKLDRAGSSLCFQIADEDIEDLLCVLSDLRAFRWAEEQRSRGAR